VRQKATGFSPAPGAQRCTPCRPQQASPRRSRAQSPDNGIFAEDVLNEKVAQTSAVAPRSQPPKPASLRDAGFAAPCGGAGMWLLLCPRVALRGPLID